MVVSKAATLDEETVGMKDNPEEGEKMQRTKVTEEHCEWQLCQHDWFERGHRNLEDKRQ